jgi:hypothetical protein
MAKALRGNRAPPRILQPGERARINAVIDPDLLAAIDAAADRAGRSRMSEIEIRLRQTVDWDAAFGGARARNYFQSFGAELAAYYGDDSWLCDPARFERAREHIINRLRATRIIPQAEGDGQLADIAVDMFIRTRDPLLLAHARELAEHLPFERRAKALAKISEIEANPEAFRPRRLRVRVYDDGRPLENLPDSEGADTAEPPPESGRE